MSRKNLSNLYLYPDFGTDLDGYDLNTLKIVIAAAGVVILIGVMAFSDSLLAWMIPVLYSLSFICAGIFCFTNLFLCVKRGRIFCEVLPVLIACIIMLSTKLYVEATIAVLFYEAAKIFEVYSQKKEHERAESVLNILPNLSTVALPGKETRKRKPVHLHEGDVVLVRPGEIIPIDGYVIDGMTTVDYSSVTMGMTSKAAGKGSAVISGGVNRGKPVLIRATCDYNGSAAKKIFSSFSSSINRQSSWGVKSSKAYNIIYPAVIAAALVIGVVIPIFTHNWSVALKRAAAVLLCACPIGLIDILDLCVFSGVRKIFASGAVIRDGRLLDGLSRIETFVCNKTGTVTSKNYSVIEVMPAGFSSEEPCDPDDPAADELLDYAVKAESISGHPIACAIRKYCGAPDDMSVSDFNGEEIPGKGIAAVIGDLPVYCGNATLLFEHGINCTVPDTQGTAIHVAAGGRYLGYMVLSNEVRQGNFDALEKLRACGVKNFSLLSCDLRSVVRPIASSLSFSNVRSELSPEGKVSAVEYLMGTKAKTRTLAFLGNGSDELECASKADISAASDVLFNDEAWDKSDVAIFSEGLEKFPDVVSAAYSSMQISMAAVIANFASRAVLMILSMLGITSEVVVIAFLSLISAFSVFFVGKIQ
ncbi:MAG: HAD-IC family P-type ATPase [Eubacteriales bacterium]|nr:HAD-IC family P-type ATPase [Eubacteriales bacterium]